MKKILMMLAAVVAFSATACSQAKEKENKTMSNSKKHVLVAYFSATGTTAEAAHLLAEAADADLYEIAPEVAYTADDLDWHNRQSRSSVEMQDAKSRPAVKGRLANAAQYDTVYIGFPIWWYTAPTIVNTFIDQTDLSGKTLITFATSGGSTVTKATRDLRATYPAYTWKEGGLLNGRTAEEARALVEHTR